LVVLRSNRGLLGLTIAALVVAMSGSAIAAPVRLIGTSPKSLNFGRVPLFTPADQTIVVTNISSDTSFYVNHNAGPDPPFREFTSGCGGFMAPGDSCTMILRFQPGGTGRFSGQFVIEAVSCAGSLASVCPYEKIVDLRGTGIAPN
jgi:hypothetical protein